MTQIKLHAWGRGKPLLLLHAFPLNAAMWEPQIKALENECLLLAPDVPGFGNSADAPGFESLDELARALHGVIAARGVERAAIAGCSMGGYLAFALLRVAPGLATALAFINTKASVDDDAGRAKRLDLAQRAEREGCAFLSNEWPPSALSPFTLAQRPAVVENVAQLIAQATARGVIDAQKAMAARPDSTPLLSRIDVPAIVIQGLDDRFVPSADARAMASSISGSAFVGVSDAGHLPNLENPSPVNVALLQLVKNL